MAYIAPIHRPSSVRHALHMKLLSPQEESIVIAKANRLEVWRFTEDDHIVLFQSQMVFGTITMLQVLRPRDSPTELLFVGTDRFEYFTLTWDDASQSLATVDSFHDGGEKYLRDSQSQDRCLVDPSGHYMALLLWEGVLSVLRMHTQKNKTRQLQWIDQVRLSELFIKACTFLYSETGQPKIALLYQSQADSGSGSLAETRLSAYRLTTDDHNARASKFDAHKDREIDLDISIGSDDDAGSSAALLIPVDHGSDEAQGAGVEKKRHNIRNTAAAKAHLGGLLVVGETRLLYLDDTTQRTVEAPLKTASLFVAWARYDATHYFLADDYGVLHLLTIILSADGDAAVTALDVSPIGSTSRATCLVYTDFNRTLLVGSHHGDSQLFRIDLFADDGHFCELLQVLPNIGPILDFAVMDMGNREDDQVLANEYSSGQARLVTGSGVHKDGTLRSVRSGVGLEDIGILGDLADTRALFALRSPASSADPTHADALVASFLTETRVFVFSDEGDIEEVESFHGLDLGAQTLWAANIPSEAGDDGRILQITPTTATLADTDSGMIVATWTPPNGKTITSASANGRWALLSIEGAQLVSLSLTGGSTGLLGVAAQKDVGAAEQIACVHAAPQFLDTGVVGLWMSGSLSIVDLATLEPRHSSQSLRRGKDHQHDSNDASVPRSIVLAQVLPINVSGPTLFVAMDDGSVVTFSVNPNDLSTSGRKSVVLGMRHARLHLLPQEDGVTYNIFATTEHPSLIYGSSDAGGRIVYAAVTAEDANFVCPFSSPAFPLAIAVATDTEIKLCRTDTQKQTHVRTISVGETVRRLAYSPAERVFALGCIERTLAHGQETVRSAIRLVDEVVFEPQGDPLQLDEAGTAGSGTTELVECVIRAALPDTHGQLHERFVVGTSFMSDNNKDDDDDATLGRILVIGVDSERSPYLVSAHRLRGPCRCLAIMEEEEESTSGGETSEDAARRGPLIIAGLSKMVMAYRYTETSSMSGRLRKVAGYRTATYVVDVAVHGHMIAVGDMMKSTALVEYIPPTVVEDKNTGETSSSKAEPAKLVERARYYQASWATAVSYVGGVGEDSTTEAENASNAAWLEADGYGNLSVLARNTSGVTDDQRRKLRATSEMNLGEMVNRIRPVAVQASAKAMVHPRAFLATVEGSIYMFGTVSPTSQDLLLRFQSNIEAAVQGPGDIKFASYRGFRNAEREAAEPFRFLDGELLERFLDFDEETQRTVAAGLGPGVEDLRNIVEELKRLH